MTMKNLPFMPMYWGEYFAATHPFTTVQHGAYLLLIAFHWCNGKLPEGEENIRRITRVDRRHWPKVRDAIAPFFDISSTPETVWKHKRVMLELAQATEIVRSKRDTLTRTSTYTKTEIEHAPYSYSQKGNGNGNGRRKSVQQAAREQLAELRAELRQLETAGNGKPPNNGNGSSH